MSKVCEMFGLRSKKILDAPTNTYMGVECEIESVSNKEDFEPRDFKVTTDNSLRNNGVEYISNVLTPTRLLESFKRLHDELEFFDEDEAFSSRTSTHIHLNCRHMTDLQCKQMLLLYALFEKYFFLMVDSSRENNIHCVPLNQTYLNTQYRSSFDTIVYRWHKYTAFNLLPLKTQGSIEFRHLHGTKDANLLARWLSCIENLQQLAMEEPLDSCSISDRETIDRWLTRIFMASPQLLALDMDSLIADELLDIKLAFI